MVGRSQGAGRITSPLTLFFALLLITSGFATTAITDCDVGQCGGAGCQITTASETYQLANPIATSGGGGEICLGIRAADIALDGNNYSVTATAAGDTAIDADGSANFATIQNASIIAETAITTSGGANGITITKNNITATTWINDGGVGGIYNDSTQGNAYYFANGTGSWLTYNATCIGTGCRWATGGSDVPFSAALAGGEWQGSGEDWHPYTETSLFCNYAISYSNMTPTNTIIQRYSNPTWLLQSFNSSINASCFDHYSASIYDANNTLYGQVNSTTFTDTSLNHTGIVIDEFASYPYYVNVTVYDVLGGSASTETRTYWFMLNTTEGDNMVLMALIGLAIFALLFGYLHVNAKSEIWANLWFFMSCMMVMGELMAIQNFASSEGNTAIADVAFALLIGFVWIFLISIWVFLFKLIKDFLDAIKEAFNRG